MQRVKLHPVCVYLEFDYASGDSRPGGNVGTFNQLYPTAHSNLGYIDYIGRQNIISPSAGVTMSPARDLTLSLQQYFFWRASDHDALFIRKTGPSQDSDFLYSAIQYTFQAFIMEIFR